jgi:hypothetical protein
VDHDLDLALELAHHEHARGMRATYFLLHTTSYWDEPDFDLKVRQLAAYGHEVGLHVNVLTEWHRGEVDDVHARVGELLGRLRSSGVEVMGTAAHGDRSCYEFGYINYWLWSELRGDDPARTESGASAEGIPVEDERWQVAYPDDHRIRRADGSEFALWSCHMRRHGVEYEACRIPHDRYWTDTGGSWSRTGDPIDADLSSGRHQVLMHPIWWRGRQRIFFVLSAARSGSKWLANFVDRATSCSARHEWTLNHRRVGREMVADKRTSGDYVGLVENRRLAQQLIQQAVSHYRTVPGDVLEANVYLEPFIPTLNALGDDVTLLHLHRDGRDVVRSLLDREWYATPGDRKHRTVPIDDWAGLTQFERACWYWRYTNERIMPFASHHLRFEEIVRDPRVLSRRLDSLGIVVHPLLAEREFPKVINAAKSRRFPPYDDWPGEYRRTFERICGPTQVALGYQRESGASPETGSPETVAESDPPRAERVLDIDFVTQKPPRYHAQRVLCAREPGGVRIHRSAPDESSAAYLLLARGRWSKVPRRAALPADHWRYYTCRMRGVLDPDAAVRLFALSYDREDTLLDQEHVGTLHGDVGETVCSFAPAAGATHIALALHFGEERARHPDGLLLQSLIVDSIPMSGRYRAHLAVAQPANSR